MERKVVQTADGSPTLFLPELNEHYHSIHGARQESLHVFLKQGLDAWLELHEQGPSILEVGFGTGLNALLTLQKALEEQINIEYTTLEAYPLGEEQVTAFAQAMQWQSPLEEKQFLQLHQVPWEQMVKLTPAFFLYKHESKLEEIVLKENYDVIFFDAFAPDKQPELWTTEIFTTLFQALRPGGVLTTYSAKGQVRRNMQAAGFEAERIPGPPGKREMLRAWKAPASSAPTK